MRSFYRYAVENGGTVMEIVPPQSVLRRYIPTNPTCVKYHDRLLLNLRCVNYIKSYRIDDYNIQRYPSNQCYHNLFFDTRNVTCSLDNGKIGGYDTLSVPKGKHGSYDGLEDVRFVVWDDKLYAYGTTWGFVDDCAVIAIYELDDNLSVKDSWIVESPTHARCEKNWAAISDKPFHFIYYTNPQTIVKVNKSDSTCEIVSENVAYDTIPMDLRGNTNVVRFDENSYIGLVHTSECSEKGDLFYHFYFIRYDNDLKPITYSNKFNFTGDLCEFSCGLDFDEDNAYITFSELDATANLIILDKRYIDNIFTYIFPDTQIDSKYYYDKALRLMYATTTQNAIPLLNYYCIIEKYSDKWLHAMTFVMCYYALVFSLYDSYSIERFISVFDRLTMSYGNDDLRLIQSFIYKADKVKLFHKIDRLKIHPKILEMINPDYV